ncbi:cell wall alpha-1,3-glucan synthase Mok11 [Schizosaccharomyces pombe]|uniref:Cell wall alpha-1,3-glucan synthase mok11 n=1 Tax=Schizosaccharomyces pombe (strain 972 / ATCC 24843) TaxID=284812 RepID=MOK11_SCHPO|nr:alpha-1,3-glucan synthase Mok11 [Schizosaccharomyces pombe]Q09854.2 RecName: Full=Cell wall alpha-1,3-glucan synthase mok11 [Schizosaccharomyces pombe 972h-]CAB90796.2 alpha-1,3-glucan synthase Mok11 [Schizosaccharomyces pombe]|eukprot:NP_001018282.1 alpha-1,3-glucan synthase Mok11 [Schizosaccharomyces pombe]
MAYPLVVSFFLYIVILDKHAWCAPFNNLLTDWNLNTNVSALDPSDYWGEWENHEFFPSPEHWRFPIYTIAIDKWVDGDPTNNDFSGTRFEYDIYETEFRNGGDIIGVRQSLDYLQGMGVKAVYFAGTPFVNMPWGADQYSPLDFTLLDPHLGTINDWRGTIEEMHSKGMYVIVDLTVATLADLIGFEGFTNTTTPFTFIEHNALWKGEDRYADWNFTNSWDPDCELPRFWGESGEPVVVEWTGCYNSDFDQYGDTEAFGSHPDWQRQLSKFASVQDRLREWKPSVASKLKRLSCLVISMLDVDGFRIDKATQMTVDFLVDWAKSVRLCANRFNKSNFFIPGEVTGPSSFGAIYYNRGRQPNQRPANLIDALNATSSDNVYFLREEGENALDASAFHYSVYRIILRFLRMDGLMEIPYDLPVDLAEAWHQIVINEDSFNPKTEKYDPRHLYGVSNYDVFRWASVADGSRRLILGTMMTFFLFPGAPLIYYGDEQGLYVLDNSANNYLYGRQSMAAAPAWYIHGCYSGSSSTYPAIDLSPAKIGCLDIWNSLDHFDPSRIERQLFIEFQDIRSRYSALTHGWKSELLGNWTNIEYLPNSGINPSNVGTFSMVRGAINSLQNISSEYNFPGVKTSSSDVWILFTNSNVSVNLKSNCFSKEAIVSPFISGTKIKNLVYPYDEYQLEASSHFSQISNTEPMGCLPELGLDGYGYKLFVPINEYIPRRPFITKFSPSHDSRLVIPLEKLRIIVEFSEEMDCKSISKSLLITSKTLNGDSPVLDESSVTCQKINDKDRVRFSGQSSSLFRWSATFSNIADGIHRISFNNASTADGKDFTHSVDHFLLRVGSLNNPIVFSSANYSYDLLQKENNSVYIKHAAIGADMFRYSLDFGSTWTEWQTYDGNNTYCNLSGWSQSSRYGWKGHHIMVQYWSELTGSSNYMQESDLEYPYKRWFPHVFMDSDYTQWTHDSDIRNRMLPLENGSFLGYHIADVYPSALQFNVWGLNKDGKADKSFIYGSLQNNSFLSRVSPSSLEENVFYIQHPPPKSYLSWSVTFDPQRRRYYINPSGCVFVSLGIYLSSLIVPLLTGVLAVYIFKKKFYHVKFNAFGTSKQNLHFRQHDVLGMKNLFNFSCSNKIKGEEVLNDGDKGKRRTVLLATLEYDIPSLNICIKIGGLGVMAQLMARHLEHEDIIWVIPCVGDVSYSNVEEDDPIEVVIIDQTYFINVYKYVIGNIIYILLDAPIFRRQTSGKPYPSRADDLSSAIFYSAWNQCIASVISRNNIDLYHMNDYHGSLAPLYLLPKIIPVALSLHNAEFQGLWPLRNSSEKEEVCSVFNISKSVCSKYVQFGNVFNLLHAGASYIRIHQKGYGVVGVSSKYGKRSWARYPIFWGLRKIGKLPNPDPADNGTNFKDLDANSMNEFENIKAKHKRSAQEWANLNIDPEADLLIFVGRWTLQKGIDLIADITPTLLENFNSQIVVVGPVIDLYGKFAAEKFTALMKKYPGRIYSRPLFTQLPSYIFSGADFALIPSRDEPFGLVAVEFGRKGTLGIGAKVGGLGQMPGWWYTIESNTTAHLLCQFEEACRQALTSSKSVRTKLRAISTIQRFPVSEWVSKLDTHVRNCIKFSHKQNLEEDFIHEPVIDVDEFAISSSKDIDADEDLEIIGSSDNKAIDSNGEGFLIEKDNIGTGSYSNQQSFDFKSSESDSFPQKSPSVESFSIIDNDNPFHEGQNSSTGYKDIVQGLLAENGVSEAGVDVMTSIVSSTIPIVSNHQTEGSQMFNEISSVSSIHVYHDESQPPVEMPAESDTPLQNKLYHPGMWSSSDIRIPNNSSQLSIDSVRSGMRPFSLSKVPHQFDDEEGKALQIFREKLKDLNCKNSMNEMCIENFLMKCTRKYFDEVRKLRLGTLKPENLQFVKDPSSLALETNLLPASDTIEEKNDVGNKQVNSHILDPGFLKEEECVYEFEQLHGLRKALQVEIYGWPLYTILLAIGQVLAATSFQLNLFSDTPDQPEYQSYIVCSVYISASLFWYILHSLVPNIYALSTPFIIYATAFALAGLTTFSSLGDSRLWISRVATWIYSIASGSQALFFSLNFGNEGRYDILYWIVRACFIQGSQQVWSAALWYWGSYSTDKPNRMGVSGKLNPQPWMAAITWPIALVLLAIAFVVYRGLPNFYRQCPSKIPAFYRSLFRRRLIMWFFISVFLQNYWMSSVYGRSWAFMWSAHNVHKWAMFLLVILFYVAIWIALVALLASLSRYHSWILPILGLGFGAPRWLQTLWGTSNIGIYVPFLGKGAPYLSRMLWLYLGLLDTVQTVGIGIILLQTLTREHITVVLITGQIVGAIASMVGKASSPSKFGPGDVFIDFTHWSVKDGPQILASIPFWVCLICQLSVIIGYFLFFRRENLSRP